MSGALPVILNEHNEIHEGEAFLHSHKHTAIANNNSVDHLLRNTGTKMIHVRAALFKVTNAPVEIFFYEDPTITADGTPGLIRNLSLAANETENDLEVFTAGTFSDVGTAFDYDLVTGTKQNGGAGTDLPTEWMMPPGKEIIIRATNISGGALAIMATRIFWYHKSN